MSKWFEEKATQVQPGVLTAFGIELTSRYGKASELMEMLDFAKRVAALNAEVYVEKVFYDSKANLCTFEINQSVRAFDPIGLVLTEMANVSLRQFELFDVIGGRGFDQGEE